MRLGLISDLHGNLVALQAALDGLERVDVDRILCLGDVVDMGPQPQEVVDVLRARDILTVLGNHDPLDDPSHVPQHADIAAWSRTQLTTAGEAWLAGLPRERLLQCDGVDVLAVHGSPSSFNHQVLEDTPDAQLRAWWGDRVFDAMVFGHTHVQLRRVVDGRLVVGAGSTGMPFSEAYLGKGEPQVLPQVDFAVLVCDEGQVSAELHQLPLDVDAYLASVRASGMPHHEWWSAHWR